MKSLASIFDPLGLQCPILNRARLYLHSLQTSNFDWDTVLPKEKFSEWKNICKQFNNAPTITVPRFVGKRDATYRLVAFCDSSATIYGTVLFIQDLQEGKVSFLMARNRIVNCQLESKSIPSLELMGIVLGVENLVDMCSELAGGKSVLPIKIEKLLLFTDSMVCLNWLCTFSRLEKMNKRSIFVQNRLKKIHELCANFPVLFSFIDGISNPADFVTRAVSIKVLEKSNYFYRTQNFNRRYSRNLPE